MVAMPLPLPRAHGTTVDKLVREIRAMMLAEKLGVGDALPTERELTERFAASRNTVREALRTLKTYGLIAVRPKVGAVVADRSLEAAFDLFAANRAVSRDSFADVQAFRRLVETGIGEAVMMRPILPDFSALEIANIALRDAASATIAAEADYAFHAALIDLAENRTLAEIYRFLRPVVFRLMLLGKTRRPTLSETYADHAGVLDALRRRDRVAYAYRLSRHLEEGARYLQDTDTTGETP